MFHCHTHHRMEILQVHKKLSVLPEFCNQNSSHPLKEWKPSLFIQQTSGNRTDELWIEVCDIVQETGIKTILKKKKCKKAKWLSGAALQTAVKRREVKSKGEKERYKHLNAEFQRIARRDKKAFLSDQCKEIKENNRMGKTRELFKKIRDTKGTMQRWAR